MILTLGDFLKRYEKKAIEVFNNQVPVNPKVSVCVQTYNHIGFIKECLDGVLSQKTSFDFEILLGEDFSNDGTRSVCLEYAKKYPKKIKLILHHRENNIKFNGSPTGRFNILTNLLSANGEYIALCEGDDYWTDPLKLQKQVDFLDKNRDYGICFHETQTYFQDEKRFESNETSIHIPETSSFLELANYNFIVTPSAMLRNDIEIPLWYCGLPIGDWPLYFIQLKDRKIKKLPEEMAVYRIHGNGAWTSASQKRRLQIDVSTITPILEHINLPKEAAKRLNENYKKKIKKLNLLNLKSFFKLKTG